MTNQCWYCGRSISWLRKVAGGIHPECAKEYEQNLKQFGNALARAISSDEVIDESEAQQLDALICTLKIRKEDQDKVGLTVYKRLHKHVLDDGHLTAGERDQLKSLQNYLGLDDEKAKAKELDRLRLLTGIIEGDLPHIDPSVNLQKNEVAYLEMTTRWCHLKTRRKRVVGRRAQSVHISKGFRFKIPATPGHTEEYTELQTVDTGKIVITSKRIIFVGAQKNLNVKLDRILDLDLYSDGVTVHRGTTNATIFMVEDSKMFYSILVGAINAQ